MRYTPALRDLIGPQAMLVSMINGIPRWYFHRLTGPYEDRRLNSIDPGGELTGQIDPACVMGRVVYPAADLLVPGVVPGVVRVIEGNRFTLGEPDGSRSSHNEGLSAALMNAGFKASISKDVRTEIWVKLVGNLSFNPISALTHATRQDICRFALTRALAAVMMTEAQAVADALSIRFRITLEQRINGAAAVGAHKTSMLQDVEAGRALELPALVGAVLQLGQITAVATSTVQAIHAVTALLATTPQGQGVQLRVELLSLCKLDPLIP